MEEQDCKDVRHHNCGKSNAEKPDGYIPRPDHIQRFKMLFRDCHLFLILLPSNSTCADLDEHQADKKAGFGFS